MPSGFGRKKIVSTLPALASRSGIRKKRGVSTSPAMASGSRGMKFGGSPASATATASGKIDLAEEACSIFFRFRSILEITEKRIQKIEQDRWIDASTFCDLKPQIESLRLKYGLTCAKLITFHVIFEEDVTRLKPSEVLNSLKRMQKQNLNLRKLCEDFQDLQKELEEINQQVYSILREDFQDLQKELEEINQQVYSILLKLVGNSEEEALIIDCRYSIEIHEHNLFQILESLEYLEEKGKIECEVHRSELERIRRAFEELIPPGSSSLSSREFHEHIRDIKTCVDQIGEPVFMNLFKIGDNHVKRIKKASLEGSAASLVLEEETTEQPKVTGSG